MFNERKQVGILFMTFYAWFTDLEHLTAKDIMKAINNLPCVYYYKETLL